MLFSHLYQIMVNKVTFIGFWEGDHPNRCPGSDPAGAILSAHPLRGVSRIQHITYRVVATVNAIR